MNHTLTVLLLVSSTTTTAASAPPPEILKHKPRPHAHHAVKHRSQQVHTVVRAVAHTVMAASPKPMAAPPKPQVVNVPAPEPFTPHWDGWSTQGWSPHRFEPTPQWH